MTNLGPDKILDCNTSFERSLSKLSENYKIFDIGSTILKLRLLKDVQLHSMVRDSFGCHNLNSVDPMSNFLGFSESLEKNSSNGVIKSNI